MKNKLWLLGCSFIIILLFSAVIITGYTVDPYFHYHKPLTDKYFYEINNQRSQNDGIVKHFEYQAMISGSSMTANFATSEAENFFGQSFIKVPYFGGSYKEIDNCISTALKHNPDMSLVIRGLDMDYFISDKDNMRSDLGEYPTYLYDNNPFNDIKYLLNKDVFFGISYKMISDSRQKDSVKGITSFDDYSIYYDENDSHRKAVLNTDIQNAFSLNGNEITHLTDEEKEIITANITQNVTSTADRYPQVTFYCFFPPYSMIYWLQLKENGELERQLEAEQLVIELLLQHKNIHLYSFNTQSNITADLNNYIDSNHYDKRINSEILKSLYYGRGEITKENYEAYLQMEHSLLREYDYTIFLNES